MRSSPHARRLPVQSRVALESPLAASEGAHSKLDDESYSSRNATTNRPIRQLTPPRRQYVCRVQIWVRWTTFVLLVFSVKRDGIEATRSVAHVANVRALSDNLRLDVETQKLETAFTKRVGDEACPAEMVFIEGNYCPTVHHHCVRWAGDVKSPSVRCTQYAPEVRCTSPRIFLRFCIDREELTRPGETLPENFLSLNRAEKYCHTLGKRLCQEREWTFSCEGETMRPYPYGFSREAKCHQDRLDLFEIRNGKQVLRDLRAKSDDFPACVSPFGVVNLVGNVDELVIREGTTSTANRTALKGGWWMPARNRCRAATTAHDADYNGVQVGARCCKDAADAR